MQCNFDKQDEHMYAVKREKVGLAALRGSVREVRYVNR